MARSGQFDPLEKLRFRVSIDGFTRAGFATSSLPTESRGEILYREGQYRDTHEKSSGLTTYSDVTLGRGVTKDQDFYAWAELHKKHAANVRGSDGEYTAEDKRPEDEASNDYRKEVVIELLDRESNPVKRWNLRNAWVGEFVPGDNLDANAEEKLMTSLTLKHEGYDEEVI